MWVCHLMSLFKNVLAVSKLDKDTASSIVTMFLVEAKPFSSTKVLARIAIIFNEPESNIQPG